ncbi:small nuclear ribonucleoprotein E isoform X2 [Chlorocebus sabaeus]|uniref:small nuclear ribonucleoprotein E isoform X2 n=1 Tax=Chlorocebus sabaeus TaxID=60711 RepID=UPI003BF945A5
MSGLGATVVQNLIFRYLQNVQIADSGVALRASEYADRRLYHYDAEEIHSKTKSRKQLGRIMLKGDNITLLQSVSN